MYGDLNLPPIIKKEKEDSDEDETKDNEEVQIVEKSMKIQPKKKKQPSNNRPITVEIDETELNEKFVSKTNKVY